MGDVDVEYDTGEDAEVPMVVVDGVRYRPEDVPNKKARPEQRASVPVGTFLTETEEEEDEEEEEPVEEETETETAAQPHRGASRSAWVAYALSVDPDAKLDDLKRDEIADRYGN